MVYEYLEKVGFGEAVEAPLDSRSKGSGGRRPQGFLEAGVGPMQSGKDRADSWQGPESGSSGDPCKAILS